MSFSCGSYEVRGRTVHVVYRGFVDSHFVSLTCGSRHGAVAVASVDIKEFLAANDDIDRAAAVESTFLLGKRDLPTETVVTRKLACALATIGDARPLTVSVDLPDLSDCEHTERRDFVTGAVAVALEVMAQPKSP